MTQDSDLLIIGGGLNGPALALAAAEAGLRSIVIDALPADTRAEPDFDGRAYALALASVRLLANLGLWDRLAPDAQPMTGIRVSDGRVGEAEVFLGLDFSSAEIEEGPMGHMVEDRYLRRALLDAMEAAPQVTHRPAARVTAQTVTASGVSVTLEDGSTLTGRLLVGADGRQSGTAARAGIRRTGWSYGQTALVCPIAHEKPHEGTAHQLFLPPGPLAILPLTGNRSSIVWSERDAQAQAINALPDAEYLEVLRPRFGDFLGQITLAGPRYTYPLGLTLANAFVADRLALVGDAAHGMHPIAGQGLNAGLRDVAALAHVLSHAQRRGEDVASAAVLARYQQWRRFDTATLATATDLFNRLFSNDNPLLRLGRDLGMSLVQRLPDLRRGFLREAAGLTGDLPDLMAR
ncbi:UbiH/UbiF/VisC/COQ6 family ubiquinone biosynthesis hydroxylase [Salipiger marinus]|jgi:2-octaprenyl-6-methoxyphenol hydroxylase|uniref:UbiH/UbiF/VisC/COQ6 family ubiquinone biosynthesis hydroxylase n=1 Tax=Salipiger marinus TaxID=555512 RepID=UPI000E8C0F84|nr:UbiH/UbiF/VisC/COQ6 family ubiquinone biosynthesis hydroxylase [Salipiger manganoxidans]MCD1617079.1 UbiH/UbiF/VisC/COQ6 family ubiquinone biosynthesis hydroxylase [Salipiger manganoxidans]MEB3417127.1 UbiH/UbiF/VisC/COQ6 family ubiquinone biosynthesis hydroxylase [Salipiger manganoxidans]HBM61036.1 2-octaprenyl-6-methoxyphenyl hydroxylase [Citreicella sp.]HBT01092.1 2-octaprenyl-6-methoxyphenyl hydroxylase [Citreicella sp.]|tara:strand:- start:21 stop:1238 length:1218 start_codon:yes stop_codon:yes gene_type:complete